MKSITRKICTALMALTFVSAPLYSLPITSAAPAANEVVAYAADEYYTYTDSTYKNVFTYKLVSYTEGNQSKTGVRIERVDIKNSTVNVPSKLKGYPVVEIGNDFAARNSTITSLTLPSSVLKIGQGIGYNSAKLEKVTFNSPHLTELGGYAMHGTKYRQNQVNEGYAFFGNILFELYPDKLIKNGKIDFSASKFNGITEIIPGIGSSASSVTELRLPKNIKKWDNLANNKYPKLTGLYYFGSSYSDLKTIIKKYAENSYNLTDSDKAFIASCEKFFNCYNLNNLSEQPYKQAIIQSLAKKFLGEAGITYYGSVQTNSTFDAWKQYNVVRKVHCHIRETMKYNNWGESNFSSSFVVALLVNKGMACQQFAQMNQAMLTCAGVQTKYVYSIDNPRGMHAYNMVRIYDSTHKNRTFWFNDDSCWNTDRCYFMFKDLKKDSPLPDAGCHIRHPECENEPKCETQIGDVDMDNSITVADATLILKAATNLVALKPAGLNSKIQEVLCDVNSDGQIGVDDAQIVLSYCTDCLAGNWDKSLEWYVAYRYPADYPKK